jgi:hypothetical protein
MCAVTATEPLNLNSLKMVQDELVATIEQVATKLEQFSQDRSNGELLQDCIDGIRQISGTLTVVQMKGADLLAQELLEHINAITLGDDQDLDQRLGVMTPAFFILPRYLEYCLQTSRSMAVLLIPHINELRLARRAELLPDSYFLAWQAPNVKPRAGQNSALLNEDFAALARRLRHMYQVGLVKVLQGKQVGPSLGMIGRALERLAAVTGSRSQGNLWWVASVAVEVIRRESMHLNPNRKRIFSQLDREIRQLQKQGQKALDQEPPARLLKELLYLVGLSASPTDKVQEVIAAYQMPPLPYTDAELARELELLTGPSANTFNSMSAVLTEELRSTKNILERAAQGGAGGDHAARQRPYARQRPGLGQHPALSRGADHAVAQRAPLAGDRHGGVPGGGQVLVLYGVRLGVQVPPTREPTATVLASGGRNSGTAGRDRGCGIRPLAHT